MTNPATREFKYYPEDFGDLTVKVRHMDLEFDVFDKETTVQSQLHLTALQDLTKLDLNAKNLEILDVVLIDGEASHEYLKEEDVLRVTFAEPISAGSEFTLYTKNICRPTSNILEGMYYDETPEGAPPQQITQCQQWGFQRIVPCIDDMTAKCTYRTTIIADACYTNWITNGDVAEGPTKIAEDRVKVVYHNTITPMATYLFFLGVGTYATFKKPFQYPDGKKFDLELLVPPSSDSEIAEKALQVLHDAVMWVYEHCGYQYTGTVYREIGMQNSDFGGMENVGNTTITTNRIMPFPEMTDGAFEYMIQVKLHEFYHNLNGSEVTGRSPFEIWLNEAVTVHVEREYHAHLFGSDYSRMDTVLTLHHPRGTFARDDSAAAMPIEPDGFNDPNELITGVTYVKAPEFVRMIQTLMGVETFRKALALYHSRYKHSNASRAQWVECMEEVSGLDLQKMAQDWLKKSSYPTITVTSDYDEATRQYTVHLKQNGNWEFPFRLALVDEHGANLAERTEHVRAAEHTVIFDDVDRPAFLSLNRDHSVFGKVKYEASEDELYLQSQKDPDVVGRFLAFKELANREKLALLKGESNQPSERFVDLYFEGLIAPEMIALFEHVEDEAFEHDYLRLYEVVKTIKTAVATKYKDQLLEMYNHYHNLAFEGDYVPVQAKLIKARQVANSALALLAKLDTPDIHQLVHAQYDENKCASDRVTAFSLYLDMTAPDKMDLLKDYQSHAEKNLVMWESFLATVARSSSPDIIQLCRAVEQSPAFRIDQANDQRALFAAFAGNRKKSLLTEEGRAYLQEKILQLAPINEYNTGHMLQAFGAIDKAPAVHRGALAQLLQDVRAQLDAQKTPSVANTIDRILKNSPKAVGEGESKE